MKADHLSPEAAVQKLQDLHSEATESLKAGLDAYLLDRKPPKLRERAKWRYPLLKVTNTSQGLPPSISRAFAKFQGPGVYATTVTQPAHFRRYLIDQLNYLLRDYD